MTIIQYSTQKLRVKHTQNALELSEALGWEIVGKEFRIGSYPSITTVRGYVVVDLGLGTGMINRGPVTLNKEDIEIMEG